MKKVVAFITILALAVVLVACKDSKRTGETVEVTQTITVDTGTKNDKNEVVYKQEKVTQEMFINPTRVVTYALGVADMLDTVGLDKAGIKTFGVPKSNLPEALNKFNDKAYVNAGTLFEADYTQLDLLDPELIILDGRSVKLYSELKKRYPNADVLNASNTTYSVVSHKENVLNLGKLFPSIKAALDTEMKKIEDQFAAIKTVVSEYKVLFVLSNGKGVLSTFSTGSRYNSLYDEFGFKDAIAESVSDGGSHGNSSGLELISKINPQVIFILDRAAAVGGESGIKELEAEPQFKALDAAKNNHVFELDNDAWYLVAGGFRSTQTMINDINAFINAVK